MLRRVLPHTHFKGVSGCHALKSKPKSLHVPCSSHWIGCSYNYVTAGLKYSSSRCLLLLGQNKMPKFYQVGLQTGWNSPSFAIKLAFICAVTFRSPRFVCVVIRSGKVYVKTERNHRFNSFWYRRLNPKICIRRLLQGPFSLRGSVEMSSVPITVTYVRHQLNSHAALKKKISDTMNVCSIELSRT